MVISLENVNKSFGKQLTLNNISVTFPANGISVVVGAHDSGKTTLLRLLSGELKHDSGRISMKKMVLKAFADGKNDCSLGLKTAELYVLHTLLYRNFDKKTFDSLLSEAEIAENSKFSSLSDAEKAWFNISLVIASNADIMLFDEPLSELDSEMKVRALELLDKAAKEGRTVIVSAQEIGELEPLTTFTAALNKGNLVLAGETEKLIFSHRLFPGASTISPDFKVIGPVVNERLVEISDDFGRIATLKEIILGYINGSSS